jgi:ABC-type Zn uptake system ZnuABC Zn-binding protein ZnuA
MSSGESIPEIAAVNLEGRKLRLVATSSFIGDVLGEIAGDEAEITVLMPRGQNPHSWEPGPGDITEIKDADLIFVNGLDLEASLLEIIESMKTAPVIPVSAGVDVLIGEHGAGNPHVWFSPLNVIIWSENIESVLSRADPAHAEVYHSAAIRYVSALKELDKEIRTEVSALAPGERRMVTDHSSFDYFARDYGFVIAGKVISSSNDQAEPSARDIAGLSELIREENIRAVFVGGTAGEGLKKLAKSVAGESGRNLPVVELLSGSLTSPGNRGDTYLDFVRCNTERVIAALRAPGEEG